VEKNKVNRRVFALVTFDAARKLAITIAIY